jgi:hypothetical protein
MHVIGYHGEKNDSKLFENIVAHGGMQLYFSNACGLFTLRQGAVPVLLCMQATPI